MPHAFKTGLTASQSGRFEGGFRYGIHWRLADDPLAYSRDILWDDGTVTLQGHFERPQLLIQNGQPTHLFAATSDGIGGFDNMTRTWNMVVPLKS
jgi:hypothetical protein